MDQKTADKISLEWLKRVGIRDAKGRVNAYPYQLSGGEQQRIGIARAVVNKPSLLLADEPTGNLDPKLSSDIMNLFEQFNQVGVTVLIASHDLALIANLKHRVLELNTGQLLETSRNGDGAQSGEPFCDLDSSPDEFGENNGAW